MKDEDRLKVFISHSGKARDIWEPLVETIKKIFKCKIIWEQDEVKKYRNPEMLMEEMVRISDVAIFLLTHETEGVFHEMKLWHKFNNGNFANALVLRDHSVLRNTVEGKIGFTVTDIGFSSNQPWMDMQYIFPAINDLLKGGSLAPNLPSWLRAHNKIVAKYNWKISRTEVPVNRIRDLFRSISTNRNYRDAEQWSFRINWSAGAPELDSYSNETTCLRLYEALLQTDATRQEYELIFDALRRVVDTNEEPPRKLAASILFSGCSISTVEGLKKSEGDYPYEKNTGYERRRAFYAERVPDSPKSLLLPKEILIRSDNYERFLDSQRLILNAVSKVCKYVQCSNVEVTVSHSFVMEGALGANGSGLLAMSCTATRTNKESLAAISEVPVIIEDNKKIMWYGQPHKKPTSEYLPHWIYHNRNKGVRVTKNLIVHFHPIALLETFRRVHEREGVKSTEKTFMKGIEEFFKDREIEFHVFPDYEAHSSRSSDFGEFMRASIKESANEYSVIWKPNHGIWVFLDDHNCLDDDLVEPLLALDRMSLDAARSVCPEAFRLPNV